MDTSKILENIEKQKKYTGYHFVGDTLRDGQPIPKDGAWLVHLGLIELCSSGLHWSEHPFDALNYAPGYTLCLVECAGETRFSDDKAVSTHRKIIKRINAEKIIRGFARWQAYQVLHLWDAPAYIIESINTGQELKQEKFSWSINNVSILAKRSAYNAIDIIKPAGSAALQAYATSINALAYSSEKFSREDYAHIKKQAYDDFKLLVDMEFAK